MKSNKERQKQFKQRQADEGLKEVRGIWAKPGDHKKIKLYSKQLGGENGK